MKARSFFLLMGGILGCGARTGLLAEGDAAQLAEADSGRADDGEVEVTLDAGLTECEGTTSVMSVTGTADDVVYSAAPTAPGPGPYVASTGSWLALGPMDDLAIWRNDCSSGTCEVWGVYVKVASETPVSLGAYEVPEHAGPNGPAISVQGNGHSCTSAYGRFRVAELASDARGIARATVQFEQQCSGHSGFIAGCFRYVR